MMKNNYPLISIIVPVYNVSKFIERCTQSIINQTYKQIECIFIDDCTQDDSISIIQLITNNYNGPIKFKFITHQQNRGLSAARNTGILASNGDYLFFLDSDDEISNNCIETLVKNIIIDEKTEMALGDVKVLGRDDGFKLLFLDEGYYEDPTLDKYIHGLYYTPAWNKLFLKSFIISNKLFFQEGLIHEDFLWSFQVACHLKYFYVSKEVTYYYYRRDNSLDTEQNDVKHLTNYSLASYYMYEYAHNYSQIWENTEIYRYLFYNRYSFAIKAFNTKNVQLFNKCYNLIRMAPEGGCLKMKSRGFSGRLARLSLHRLLPTFLGRKLYFYYCKNNIY